VRVIEHHNVLCRLGLAELSVGFTYMR
jgi:hypothetical protein